MVFAGAWATPRGWVMKGAGGVQGGFSAFIRILPRSKDMATKEQVSEGK